MGCKECGKPKCNGKCGCKSPKVLQINNPAEYITFHKVSIPAAMGDSTTNPPRIGAYRNALVYYEADHTSWMYSTDGIPTKLTNGLTDYNEAANLPQINGHTLIGNQSSSDLGLQGELTAGSNIQIEDNVISATDTTYTGGDGISVENDVIYGMPATSTDLGMVKIGDGLDVDETGVVSANVKEVDSELSSSSTNPVQNNVITSALNASNQKIDTLPYNNSESVILYTFFDDTNSKISFFVGSDGTDLKKLSIDSEITGRDPSLLYKNGKFYLATTGYSSDHDFRILVSEDLTNWETHYIDISLRGTEYPKVWAPEWFVDDNGKIYIFLSKQYANTEGWGDFRTYVAECIYLDTLTFSAAQQCTLNGATSDNHIDATVVKYDGTYHMIVKDDTTTAHRLEHYTSSDLLNWTLQAVDPCNFGRNVEGQFIYKLNNEFCICAERYANRPLAKSYYVTSKTANFVNFSESVDLTYPDLDISHGGAVVIETQLLNKLIANGSVTIENEDNKFALVKSEKNFDIVATQLTEDDSNNGDRIGDYLHLFDVVCSKAWRGQSIQFRLSSNISPEIDASYSLLIRYGNNEITNIYLNEVYCSTQSSDKTFSVAGRLVAVKDKTNASIAHVYLDITGINAKNMPLSMDIQSEHLWYAKITKYVDKFLDNIDLTSGVYMFANGSPNSRTIILNNGTKTKARVVFASYNGSLRIGGHINGVTDDKRMDAVIQMINGTIGYINKNSNLNAAGRAITVTKESYDSAKREYSILFENLPSHTAIELTLQPSHCSYFKSVAYEA